MVTAMENRFESVEIERSSRTTTQPTRIHHRRHSGPSGCRATGRKSQFDGETELGHRVGPVEIAAHEFFRYVDGWEYDFDLPHNDGGNDGRSAGASASVGEVTFRWAGGFLALAVVAKIGLHFGQFARRRVGAVQVPKYGPSPYTCIRLVGVRRATPQDGVCTGRDELWMTSFLSFFKNKSLISSIDWQL